MPQVDFDFGVPILVMPDVYLRDGAVLIRDGLVAMSEDCCCEPNCDRVFSVSFAATDTWGQRAEIGAAFLAFLAERGYSDRTFTELPETFVGYWTATCCE